MYNSNGKGTNQIPINELSRDPDIKSKRDEYIIDTRRKKRQEILLKKRNLGLDKGNKEQENTTAQEFTTDETFDPKFFSLQNFIDDCLNPKVLNIKTFIDKCLRSVYTTNDFHDLVIAINSDDKFQKHYGIIGIRKLLSTETDPPIQKVIDANLVPRMIHFMQIDDEPRLQLEATWALTRLVSGTPQQTQIVIDKNGIPNLIRLFKSEKTDIADAALQAISYLSEALCTYRDIILECGGLEPVISIIHNTKNESIFQRGASALVNLCKGGPPPKLERIYHAIPTLSEIIQKSKNIGLLADASWALSHFLNGEEARTDLVVETGIIPSLVRHLEWNRKHSEIRVLFPILRTLEKILAGNKRHTNMVLEVSEVVEKLFNLLNYPRKDIRREACRAISNITLGNSEQLEHVIKDPSQIYKIVGLVCSKHLEVRIEAIWALSNATGTANAEQMARLCEQGALKGFCHSLEAESTEELERVLVGISNVLQSGEAIAKECNVKNKYAIEIEGYGAVRKIQSLQNHQSVRVYPKASQIMETYFEEAL